MNSSAEQDVTTLLKNWRAGDAAALESLTPLVYSQLKLLARGYLSRERAGHTLQPTALIHEAYVRLVKQDLPCFENRAHFFGVGGDGERVELDQYDLVAADTIDRFLALHEALEGLAKMDARKSRVIELKYFGGMSRDEIAEHMGLTLATVKRDLAFGEAYLRRELAGGEL
jgi:RNA polymerase sigma-70 factor, ECF subfamily